MASAPAFQAGNAGSIPVVRLKKTIKFLMVFFKVSSQRITVCYNGYIKIRDR